MHEPNFVLITVDADMRLDILVGKKLTASAA